MEFNTNSETNIHTNTFFKDVAKLVTGTTFAQILTFISAPILARVYQPVDYGSSAIFISICTIITVIICGRYELAILLPDSDDDALNICIICLSFSLLISILSIPIIVIAKDLIVTWLKSQELGSYLWLLPITNFVNGVLVTTNYWFTRKNQYGILSRNQMLRSIVLVGIQLLVGFLGRGSGLTIVWATLISSAIAAIDLVFRFITNRYEITKANISVANVIFNLKRYKKFPLYDSAGALLNSVSWQLPNFFISFYFSQIQVGYYSLGTRLLRIPMAMIGFSIGQVFYQRSVLAKRDNALDGLVTNTFQKLTAIGLFPLLILTLIGQDAFKVFFGITWAEAGLYVQILSIWTFFWFISAPISALFKVLEKQEYNLKLDITIFLSRLIVLLLGGLSKNIYILLYLFSITGIFLYGYMSLAVMNMAKVSISNALKILGRYFGLFLPFGILVYLIQSIIKNPWAGVITGSISLLVYYALIFYRDRKELISF